MDKQRMDKKIKIESFYKKYFDSNKKVIELPLKALRELKKEGVTTEQFLDYLCQKQGLLLHGSIHQVKNGKLTSKSNKIFASNKSVIAIMRSLYSNVGVNLEYPYFINDKNLLILKIHTRADGKFTKKDAGFIYVMKSDGFKNEPKGSWQFVKKTEKIDFIAVIETENNDFTYPVEVFNDFDLKESNKNKNMDKIKILNAVHGDELEIILLMKKTWLAIYPNKKHNITREDIIKKDWESKERLERWEKTTAGNGKNGTFNFVAKEANKIVGFCQVVKEKNYNELKIIYILPEYQGRGIGKMLVHKALSLLDHNKDVIIEVVEYNENAIGFYERLGFVEFEKGKGHKVPNGKVMPTIKMKFKKDG